MGFREVIKEELMKRKRLLKSEVMEIAEKLGVSDPLRVIAALLNDRFIDSCLNYQHGEAEYYLI